MPQHRQRSALTGRCRTAGSEQGNTGDSNRDHPQCQTIEGSSQVQGPPKVTSLEQLDTGPEMGLETRLPVIQF